MTNSANDNTPRNTTTKRATPKPEKEPEKVKPDEGQGSKGDFGDDGDWGKQTEDLKRKQREASPIPIKEAK